MEIFMPHSSLLHHRLQYLNLQRNCISGIPYLQPTGASDSLSAEDRHEEGGKHSTNSLTMDLHV